MCISSMRAIKLVSLILYGCFLIALSSLKTNKILLPFIYQLESELGGDKLMHLILSLPLSFLAFWALVPERSKTLNLNFSRWTFWCFCISLLLIFGLLIDELHQIFVGSRRFEWLDFAYGVGGIGIGFVIFAATSLPKLTHKY